MNQTSLQTFFSGNNTIDWVGCNGFGFTTAVRRDRLPPGVPKKCLHRERSTGTARTKACRFLKSVVLKKEVEFAPNKTRKKLHVIMQSTSSCDFGNVSASNEVKLFAQKKERVNSMNKRHWAI